MEPLHEAQRHFQPQRIGPVGRQQNSWADGNSDGVHPQMEFTGPIADHPFPPVYILVVGQERAEPIRGAGRSDLEAGRRWFQDQRGGGDLRQPEAFAGLGGLIRGMRENATPNGELDSPGQFRPQAGRG